MPWSSSGSSVWLWLTTILAPPVMYGTCCAPVGIGVSLSPLSSAGVAFVVALQIKISGCVGLSAPGACVPVTQPNS